MEADDEAREALRRRARTDDPLCQMASTDMDALARFDGAGSAAEEAAVRRTDFEAWIPGLEARPTVMTMGWTIFAAVVIAGALSWLPMAEWLSAAVGWVAFGVCTIAVAASVWSILSEMRGWEGSNAAYWFRKGRVKRYRKARDLRHREILRTLIAVSPAAIRVYKLDGEIIRESSFAPAVVESLAIDRNDTHVSLKLNASEQIFQFDLLRRDVSFETAIERFQRAMDETKTGPLTAAVA